MTHVEVPQITMADIRKHTGEGMVSEQSVIDAANEVLKEIYTSPPPAAGWNEAQTRRMFEAEFAKNLDLTEDKDAWGQPKFKHSHVDALYEGWRRAIESLRREAAAPDGVVSVELLNIERATGDRLRLENDKLRATIASLSPSTSRPDAGGGVSLNDALSKLTPENIGHMKRVGGLSPWLEERKKEIREAISNPPAAVESNASAEAAHLFCEKDFIGAGGQSLSWKIECDVLSDADLKTIAAVCAPSLPKFCGAVGVPCGGLRLAAAMNAYADPAAKRVLIVDDVWTTGKSMTAVGASYAEWIGFVAFARGPLPSHVSSFMSISSADAEARLREALEHYAKEYCEGWCEQDAGCANFDHDCGGCLARRALSAVGDEAKKSEGRTDEAKARADAVASGSASHENHGSQIQTGVGSERSGPSEPTAERREIVARIKADPGDGTLHPDLAHVLARGFDTMGWDRPASAAEDMIDAILAALDGGAGA